jgi:hypothetical protein
MSAADTALWLAINRGWYVYPLGHNKKPLAGCDRCRSGSPLPVADRCLGHADCACLARGDGAHCHAVCAATNDPTVIRQWARKHRDVWAVDCGRSGLLVVDLDTHPGTSPQQPLNGRPWPSQTALPADGVHTWAALAGLCGVELDLNSTLVVKTPSGGLHIYYAAEAGRWSGSTPKTRDDQVTSGVGWQVDVKAHGGCVLLPGSVTDTGTYKRVSSATLPGPMPSWVEAELRRVGLDKQEQDEKERLRRAHYQPPGIPVGTDPSATACRGARYAAKALRSACEELASTPPPEERPDGSTGRNWRCYRSASRLAGMVERGWIDRDQVERALFDAADTAHLPLSEIRYAIASGFRHPQSVNLSERAA